MKKAHVAELFRRLRELTPDPTTELLYRNPFELLIAVILSAHATDKSVNKATPALFAVAPDAKSMAALGEEKLMNYIKNIGLYRAKAKNLIKTCQLLVEKHHGEVPESRESLEALAGVGRKTANVILNTIFRHPLIAVDTHVFRVANRTGLAAGKTVNMVEKKLSQVVPDEFQHDAHHWLILHGRYTCIARKPQCYRCPIVDLCEYKDKNLTPPKTKE